MKWLSDVVPAEWPL